MSQEKKIVAQFGDAIGGVWHSNYDSATVLLLSWEEDDLNVVREHAKLDKLFGNTLNFEIQKFSIPSESSSLKLQKRLLRFVEEKGTSHRSLLIVYYAGHADDEDPKLEQGYSEWRAHVRENSPTLKWWPLQPTLYHAKGDLLIILDCCHAALRNRLPRSGKLEILAACNARGKVPKPGRLSFTSVLVKLIEKRLRTHNEVSIKWLNANLWSDSSDLEETPVYCDLSEYDSASINLTPLIPRGFAQKKKKPSSYIFLRVSLDDDPTGLQIASWLKRSPPSILRGVDVEALVLKARNLQDIEGGGAKAMFPGSILGNLPKFAQEEIIHQVRGLSQIVHSAAASAEYATAHTQDTKYSENTDQILAGNALKSLHDSISAVKGSIETQVLFDNNTNLEEASKDDLSVAADFQDLIELKQLILATVETSYSLEIPRRSLTFHDLDSKSRFRYGTYKDQSVVVEYFSYLPSIDIGVAARTTAHLERMTKQLSIPKRDSFRIMKCFGYIQEPNRKRFGIVFDVSKHPDTNQAPQSLQELYSKQRHVSLNARLHLAFVLAKSLSNFHQVGWVHKKFNSGNICFFTNSSSFSDISQEVSTLVKTEELKEPWLFRFEYSRPEDADTLMDADFDPDFYRHPERWGRPLARFERAHDIYSLGVVLIEIARWKRISKSFFGKESKGLQPETLQQSFINFVREELPYFVGRSYTQAVLACLSFKDLASNCTELEAYQKYNNEVLAKLSINHMIEV